MICRILWQKPSHLLGQILWQTLAKILANTLTFHLPFLCCLKKKPLAKMHAGVYISNFCRSKLLCFSHPSKISSWSLTDFWKKTKLIRHSVSSGLKFRLKASSADTLTEESWLLYERGRLLNLEIFLSIFQRSWDVCSKTSRPKSCCQILNWLDFAICISPPGKCQQFVWMYLPNILSCFSARKTFLEFIPISEEEKKVSLTWKGMVEIPNKTLDIFSKEDFTAGLARWRMIRVDFNIS